MQVSAGHGATKVPNARRRRRQWRSERTKKRQLQARPVHRKNGCHSPLAPRGYSYAPRAEQASLMTEIHSKCPASATALQELVRRGETPERQRSDVRIVSGAPGK